MSDLPSPTRLLFDGRDRAFEVTPGVIDAESVRAFMTAQCHALALEIHDRTGWPLVGLTDEFGEVGHVMIRTPSGRLLDITGAWDADDLLDENTSLFYDVEDLAADEVRGFGSADEWAPRTPLASLFADVTLRYETHDVPCLERMEAGSVVPDVVVELAHGAHDLRFVLGENNHVFVYARDAAAGEQEEVEEAEPFSFVQSFFADWGTDPQSGAPVQAPMTEQTVLILAQRFVDETDGASLRER